MFSRGNRIPTKGTRYIDNFGQQKFEGPDFWVGKMQTEDRSRPGYQRTYIFETRVGDTYIVPPAKKSDEITKSTPLKFAQINILTPDSKGYGDNGRASELTMTAWLGESNQKTYGNPSLRLQPDKQEPGSLAMLRRALKTDPQFLVKLFREFAPQAFEVSDGGAVTNTNYYPADGKKYPMRIIWDTPGLNTVDFEEDSTTDLK